MHRVRIPRSVPRCAAVVDLGPDHDAGLVADARLLQVLSAGRRWRRAPKPKPPT
jgi:hypothetical protein